MKFLLNKDNKPVAHFKDDHKFTKLEEKLNIVSYDVSEEDLFYVMNCCYWKDGEFVLTLSNTPLNNVKNKLTSITKDSFTKKLPEKQKFLQDSHLAICSSQDVETVRKEYVAQFLTLVEYEGFDKVVAATQYGCYDDIAEAIDKLPKNSKTALKDSQALSQSFKDLLVNVWEVIPQ